MTAALAFPPLQDSRALIAPPAPGTPVSEKDRRVVEVLAAPDAAHRRLLRTARLVPLILADSGEKPLAASVELYGSLSLDMTEPLVRERQWQQDWASYYINGRSDVDFVVELKPGVTPGAVSQRLTEKGWRVVGETHVHKFATTQYTLLGGDAREVYLDVTCIGQAVHFERFKRRQEAFRRIFLETRHLLESQFAAQGALAFDAYIHLLKAFAAKVPGNALTGFQATCLGLFTLQIGHYRLKPTQSVALSLFEGFLRFCAGFFGEPVGMLPNMASFNYRHCAIDLGVGGRWMPRMDHSWRSELYFMAAEATMRTRPDERVNVCHSLDPASVSTESQLLLRRAFANPNAASPW